MRRIAVIVAVAGSWWSASAAAQVPVTRTRFELPSSNGHGAIVVHLDDADPGRARKVTHFREHLFAVEEPVLDANGDEVWNGSDYAAVYTRDLLYDAYFGLRAGGDQQWLPSVGADLDASGYVGWTSGERGGTGIVQLVQQVGGLEATSFFFAPQALEQAAFAMVLRVRNDGGAPVNDVHAFSLHNVHLGYGRAQSPFDVPNDIGENGETLEHVVDASGEAFVERGFAGVVAARAMGDVAHFATAPGANPFAIVYGGGTADLPDNPPSATAVDGAVGAWQLDLGDLAAGEEAWVAVVVAHEGDPFAGAGTLAIVDDWIDGRSAQELVDDEIALWADVQSGLAIPADSSAAEEQLARHGAAMLRMGQVREGETYLREWLAQDGEVRRTRFPGTLPGVVEHHGTGAVLASLPPGNWTYAWIRDGAYAVHAMARLGMQAEARDALAFYLQAEAGRFQEWSELQRYDMPPYQISLVRYYGFGVEETDFNAFGPNLEFDGFGLFLWALRAYERTTGDETLADENWALVSERVADVLVALVEPSTGLLRPDSSIWETHWNGRERHWAYTNITAVRGLCDAAEIAERNGDDSRAQTYRDTAEAMRDAIASQLTDGDGFIASNLEELEAGNGYADAAVLDAIAMGLFDPEGAIATGTLAGLDARLLVEASEVGWSRNDDRTDHGGGEDLSPWGSDYDSAEWVITDLRGAVAARLGGDAARSDAILEWVLAQSEANYLMVAETYEENTGEYKFNTPMLGFGAGAWVLALAARAGDVDEPACGEYWEGGDGGTDSSGSSSESGSESAEGTDSMATSGPTPSGTSSDPITISESLDGSSDTDPGAACPEGSECPSSCACTTDRSPGSGPWLLVLLGMRRRRLELLAVVASIACSADDAGGSGECSTSAECTSSGSTDSGSPSTTADTSTPSTSAGSSTQPATSDTTTGGSVSESSASVSESGASADTEGPTGNAREWIIEHFAGAPIVSGDFDERTQVEAPALVMGATGTNAKYAFETRDDERPFGPEVGFVDVEVVDLVSTDAFGGAIQTSYSPGAILYIANMRVEPNWPAWQDYDTTNYDGIVLDESAEFYAEDLTIVDWNADSAIDIKAPIAQFVRLETEGGGNRTLRFWEDGPHYLVESNVNNPAGTVLWFSDCDAVTLNVYASTFNGAEMVAEGDVECENGSSPNIVYLDTDPRTTGEMHPMFGAP